MAGAVGLFLSFRYGGGDRGLLCVVSVNWDLWREKAPLKRGLRPKGGGGFFLRKDNVTWKRNPTSRLRRVTSLFKGGFMRGQAPALQQRPRQVVALPLVRKSRRGTTCRARRSSTNPNLSGSLTVHRRNTKQAQRNIRCACKCFGALPWERLRTAGTVRYTVDSTGPAFPAAGRGRPSPRSGPFQ